MQPRCGAASSTDLDLCEGGAANDLLITAHARALGLTLVTNNTAEFGRVPDLLIENWAEPFPGGEPIQG
jgi:predicted nucleic acid-binding protein